MITNSLVKIKDHPPFAPELEGPVLLNPLARVTRDKAGELSFPAKLTKAPSVEQANFTVLSESLGKTGDSAGVGVDHGVYDFMSPARFLTLLQNSFLPSPPITRSSSLATLPTMKSPTASPNQTQALHLPLDGLERRPSSSLWVSNLKAPHLLCATLRSFPTTQEFLRCISMGVPKKPLLVRRSPKSRSR
jgi:hypothetical protein